MLKDAPQRMIKILFRHRNKSENKLAPAPFFRYP